MDTRRTPSSPSNGSTKKRSSGPPLSHMQIHGRVATPEGRMHDYVAMMTGARLMRRRTGSGSQAGVRHMKPLRISEDIVPLDHLEAEPGQVVRRLQASRRPIVLTEAGRPVAVLITPEDYDERDERTRFVQAVTEGLEDATAGRVIDGDELDRELDAEFGALKSR